MCLHINIYDISDNMTEVSESMYCIYIGYVHCNIEEKKKNQKGWFLASPLPPTSQIILLHCLHPSLLFLVAKEQTVISSEVMESSAIIRRYREQSKVQEFACIETYIMQYKIIM